MCSINLSQIHESVILECKDNFLSTSGGFQEYSTLSEEDRQVKNQTRKTGCEEDECC